MLVFCPRSLCARLAGWLAGCIDWEEAIVQSLLYCRMYVCMHGMAGPAGHGEARQGRVGHIEHSERDIYVQKPKTHHFTSAVNTE